MALLDMDPVLVVQNITMNSTQYFKMRQEIFQSTLLYMEIALLIGAAIGMYVGWEWRKYYQNKENAGVTDGSEQE